MEELETINPFTLAPWEKRVQTITNGTAAKQADTSWAVRIAGSSSARNDVVGIGGAIEMIASVHRGKTYDILLYSRQEIRTESVNFQIETIPKLVQRASAP